MILSEIHNYHPDILAKSFIPSLFHPEFVTFNFYSKDIQNLRPFLIKASR